MPDYTFESLNDKEFEELVRDLLQAEFELFLQSFGRGRDNGIDLRFSRDYQNELIVQAKHYVASGFSKLFSNLKRSEQPKVVKIAPKRYILATSVSLSPGNKDSIKEIFEPFIASTQDILGLDDLCNLLRKHPSIARSNYKLWITSTAVFDQLLNNAIHGRSGFFKEKISREIARFVHPPNYDRAKEVLSNQSFVIITGAPGVGKTTLANMLAYKLLAEGFELIKISDKIQEAEQVFSPSNEKRQVFYFDDFLGSTHREILFPRNQDSTIVSFMERIRVTPNKLLILTSRTNIYNQVSYSSERYRRVPFNKYECEIELRTFSTQTKAKVLYNHLYFSDLPEEYKDEICKEKNYWKIIKHRNYNPRIIEQITSRLTWESVEPEQYLDLVLSKLANPVDIWKGAYENQLTHEARCLLVSLYSLEINWGGVHEMPLRRTFQARMQYERENNGVLINHNAFDAAIALLQKGMVSCSTNLTEEGEYREFRVHDPSIIDFLNTYISKSLDEKAGLLSSICYLEQFERFWALEKSETVSSKRDLGLIPISEQEKRYFQEAISNRQNEYEFLNNDRLGRSDSVFIAFVLSHLCCVDEVIASIIEHYKRIELQKIPENQLEMFLQFLIALPDTEMRTRVIEDLNEILSACFSISTEWEFVHHFLSHLLNSFGIDYEQFMESPKNKTFIQAKANAFWERNITKKINYEQRFVQHVYNDHEFDRLMEELKKELEASCLALMIEPSPAFGRISEIDKEDTVYEGVDYANRFDAWGADSLEQDRIDMYLDSFQDGIQGIDNLFG